MPAAEEPFQLPDIILAAETRGGTPF
jgi:hypothetical protein